MVERLRYVAHGDVVTNFQGYWIIYETQRRGGASAMPSLADVIYSSAVNERIDWLVEHYPEEYVVSPT